MKNRRLFGAVCIAAASAAAACGQRVSAQVCVPLTGGTVTENFNALAATGSGNTTLPTGVHFLESGTGGNLTYTADNGSLAAGNTYSYGSTGSADRALGELTSGTVASALGACFVNNSGAPITSFQISYTGEQWRLGAADAIVDRLDFQYSLDATSLSTGTWINVNSLDFVSPTDSGAVGPKDGNAAANRTLRGPVTINFCQTPVPQGATFFVRWVSVAAIGGTNDGLAIDDLSIVIDTPCTADGNGDGTVNVTDLLNVISQWGDCPP